jgi:anti-anti-sigma regulatory factor
MPKYQHRIDRHRLFLVEPRGDTLIVSPKGDPAGFANLNFNIEHAAILNLLEDDKYQNVVVDLGASNYFGAKILGAFSEWSDRVKAKEGQFAVCELSSDMKELLNIFQFNGEWRQFDTLEQGIKEIVSETPLEVMRSHWKQLAFVLLALIVVGLSFLPWKQYYVRYVNQRDYATVLAIWEEMQALKAANAPPPEWRKLQSRAARELEPIIPKLQKRAGTQTDHARVAQQLLFATRDNIMKRLLRKTSRMELYRPVGPKKEHFWKMTALHMEKARRIMNGEDDSDLTFPLQSQPPPEVVADAEEEAPSPAEGHAEAVRRSPPAIAESPMRYPYSHDKPDSDKGPNSHGEPNSHREP